MISHSVVLNIIVAWEKSIGEMDHTTRLLAQRYVKIAQQKSSLQQFSKKHIEVPRMVDTLKVKNKRLNRKVIELIDKLIKDHVDSNECLSFLLQSLPNPFS